jgi:hypothetical protein
VLAERKPQGIAEVKIGSEKYQSARLCGFENFLIGMPSETYIANILDLEPGRYKRSRQGSGQILIDKKARLPTSPPVLARR